MKTPPPRMLPVPNPGQDLNCLLAVNRNFKPENEGKPYQNDSVNPAVGPWLKDVPQNGSNYYIWVANDGSGRQQSEKTLRPEVPLPAANSARRLALGPEDRHTLVPIGRFDGVVGLVGRFDGNVMTHACQSPKRQLLRSS